MALTSENGSSGQKPEDSLSGEVEYGKGYDPASGDAELVADGPASEVVVSQAVFGTEHEVSGSHFGRARRCLNRHKGKVVLGAVGVGAVLTFTNNPAHEVAEDAMKAFPYVAAGVAGSEAAFIGGAALMVIAVGDRIGNPLTLKDRLPDIAARADQSWWFKAGFVINTVGAFGTAAAVGVGVAKLPVEAWPALSFAVGDAALTIAVRKTMLDGIRKHRRKRPISEDTAE